MDICSYSYPSFSVLLMMCVSTVSSTSCTPDTLQTCVQTLFVTGSCEDDTCQCEEGYRPVDTGCVAQDLNTTAPIVALANVTDREPTTIEEVLVHVDPAHPLELGHMTVSCLVRAPTIAGVTFTWWYDGHVIEAQVDQVLQINELNDAAHGSSKVYTCDVRQGQQIITSESAPVLINEVTKRKPILTSNPYHSNLTKGGNYTAGQHYVLTCDEGGWSVGAVMEISITTYKDGELTSSQNVNISTYSIESYHLTANDVMTVYQCRIHFRNVTSHPSNTVTIVTPAVSSIKIKGIATPMWFFPWTVRCDVITDEKNKQLIKYRWFKDGVLYPTKFDRMSISNRDLSKPVVKLQCKASLNSQEYTSSVFVMESINEIKEFPTILGPSVVQKDTSYEIKCMMPYYSEISMYGKYTWTFKGEGMNQTEQLSYTKEKYKIEKASQEDAGAYQCYHTHDKKDSPLSDVFVLTYVDKNGKMCESCADCVGSRDRYTGHCINGTCQCSQGTTLQDTSCELEVPILSRSAIQCTPSSLLFGATLTFIWMRRTHLGNP